MNVARSISTIHGRPTTEKSASFLSLTPWGKFNPLLFGYPYFSMCLPQKLTHFCAHRGFVAADALFLTLSERKSDTEAIFPPIQGILTFDTPYNGLARSMFVYGAFSNYQKVSSVFNAMTALSAAAPAGFSRLTGNRSASTAAAASASSAAASGSAVSGSSMAWQAIAVKTGTVGAIAAGGVAAYVHREAIMNGVRNIKNLNKDSVVDGYNQSIGALGQGLAYINRGNVGRSFAWLSDHFTFVGSLMKQRELASRLERLAALKGVGVHDFYVSLGANGYWSGGYFVPERTFCAVPEDDHAAAGLFERRIMASADDEIKAHMSLFRPQKHRGYEGMTERAADLVKQWFLADEPIFDAGYKEDDKAAPEKKIDEKAVDKAVEKAEKADDTAGKEVEEAAGGDGGGDDSLPDESPVDIAAAAALVPLPGSEENLVGDASLENADTEEKRTYLQHLFQLSQQAGTGMKEWWPSNMPDMSSLPKAPTMPKVQMPSAVSSLGSSVHVPNMNIFKKKDGPAADVSAEDENIAKRQKTSEGEQQTTKEDEAPAEGADVAEKVVAPADSEDTAMTEAPPKVDEKATEAVPEAVSQTDGNAQTGTDAKEGLTNTNATG